MPRLEKDWPSSRVPEGLPSSLNSMVAACPADGNSAAANSPTTPPISQYFISQTFQASAGAARAFCPGRILPEPAGRSKAFSHKFLIGGPGVKGGVHKVKSFASNQKVRRVGLLDQGF